MNYGGARARLLFSCLYVYNERRASIFGRVAPARFDSVYTLWDMCITGSQIREEDEVTSGYMYIWIWQMKSIFVFPLKFGEGIRGEREFCLIGCDGI